MSKEVPETVLLKEGVGQVSEVSKTPKDYVIIPKQKRFEIVDLVKNRPKLPKKMFPMNLTDVEHTFNTQQ
jgi:hypothetical protein